MTEKEYHLGHKHSYEVFLYVEEVIDKGTFPIISSFVNEELALWEQMIKQSHNPMGKFLELGCGGGRAIIRLKKFGLNVLGVDVNPYLLDHCRNRGLDVQQVDVLVDEVPDNLQAAIDFTVIGFNTFYNFGYENRKKWVKIAYDTLKPGGLFMLSYYTDNKYVDTYTDQRMAYYDLTSAPPEGYYHEVYDNGSERGIRMINPEGNVHWQSAWKRKEDVLNEAKEWKGFKVHDMVLFPCKIGHLLVLEKI